jgi:hypothetical protein
MAEPAVEKPTEEVKVGLNGQRNKWLIEKGSC